MENHYFDDDAKLVDDPHTLTFFGQDKELVFETNSGLFAKEKIDYFSIVLVENINKSKVDSYLDLGCGYGFVGIALAQKYPDAEKYFIDITKRAIEYTNINIEKNQVSKTHVIQSDGIVIDQKFDVIALNPPIHAGKETMYRLYEEAKAHLSEQGSLYIVLHKKHGALSTIKDMEKIFNHVEILHKKKGLFVIELSK